ncbi:hypothetical protein GCK72_019862 [Caenorhabditis remanei]|uniref:Uncharacterized protein n=1 Tax=Caenorhabditis remanei TaxID=31234 RepID=A0A6A5GF28_CAERE|nr:hypothetical protein GCK72_019862 [Caenorhabditis remanei]KAF1753306.1 hypothetical protein GCK72_019862 [Caenorhabditis remanei]
MILVVDVLNVFNKCRTSSILLFVVACLILNNQVHAQSTAAPPYAVKEWDLESPIGSIQGTYQMEYTSIDDHPPTLATLWELGTGDFDVTVWPPKYCAAVHVLFLPASSKGVGKFHVTEKIKTAPYIKFYPPIGRIDVSLDGTDQGFSSHFNQRSSVRFKHESSSKYVLEVAAEYVDKIRKFNDASSNMKSVNFDLMNKVALVLTNSRYCIAHITRDGRNTEFYQLFSPEHYKDKNKLPQVLTTYLHPTGISSLFMPVVNPKDGKALETAKTVDLLPVLKPTDPVDLSKSRLKDKCNGYVTTSKNKLKKAIGLITGESWLIRENNNKIVDRYESVTVSIGPTCSWIRLWITKETKQMDQYEKEMKLSETIDIFFEQQFFVGPDSDEARPLAGSSSNINKLKFRRHKPNPDQKKYIVQMSYGRDSGPSLPYIEYFQMPSFHEQSMRFNLIKAPNCEANIISASEVISQTANPGTVNLLSVGDCKRFVLKNVNKVDVADE